MATLAETIQAVQDYTTYEETTFVANIPQFIMAAEERIFYFVQLPNFRQAAIGAFTSSNQYLQLPTDFLAAASLAITIPSTSEYVYLLNKDVNYIREVYPNPSTTGVPYVYALFDDNTIIVGPTPAASYATELDYFYKPASLTDAGNSGTTWLSINAYDTLLYGTLSEAANYLKKEAGIDSMGDEYEKRFLVGLQALKNLGEARDRKDTYRSGEKRTPE